MKREYLIRGIFATVFAVTLLIGLFFGIKYFLKDSCNRGIFESIKTNKDCIKINPSCKEKTLEITNNCNKDYLITDYSLGLNQENIEYSDLSGSIKNLIVILAKDNNICYYDNISMITPKSEKDIIQMKCNNLFIPSNYKTIIQTQNSFSIKNNELSIEGSWK